MVGVGSVREDAIGSLELVNAEVLSSGRSYCKEGLIRSRMVADEVDVGRERGTELSAISKPLP